MKRRSRLITEKVAGVKGDNEARGKGADQGQNGQLDHEEEDGAAGQVGDRGVDAGKMEDRKGAGEYLPKLQLDT